LIISRSVLTKVADVSDKSCRENRNTHFMFNKFFPPKIGHLRDNLKKKYCREGHATDNNMAHARCMLDTQGYKHTLRNM